ncbi:MAG: glycosyltransferase family 4 protein [Gammaproteobacteria bacterium]
MKIGLNATCFNNRPSGARQRFLGIYSELIRRLPDTEFVVYEPADCRVGAWFDGAPNVCARRTPLPSEGRGRRLFEGFRYWRAALPRERGDLFEEFNLPLVKAPTGQTLLTIHDIRGLHQESGAFMRSAYKAVLGRSLKAADHVITVSEAMKEEILGFYPGVPISVIYNGYDAREFDRVSESDLRVVRLKYALPVDFVLAVGHFEKRKNYLRLIDAIALLRDRGRSCSLLIVGNDSGQRKAIEEKVVSANLSRYVQILTGLSDFEVRCAYKLCSLFVFPSSYEGFGIPILESMAAGCPMVLSDIPVFREITQNNGVYFRQRDIESMALAIENVLSSNSERARLVEYGNERIKAFGFQSVAAQMERLYNSLL